MITNAVEAQFANVKEEVDAFALSAREKLESNISSDQFLQFIHDLEEINRHSYHLYGFSSLSFAANTQDQSAQTLLARVQQFMAEMQNQTLFFELWWKQLDDENANRLMSSAGDYRYWLEEMRNFKKFTLSEAEEKVINIKDVTGASATRRLYNSITNRYTFKLPVNGEEKDLTRGELMVHVRRSDADLRAKAYQELYRVYSNDAPILGQIYQALVRDWHNENIQLRGFSNPISVRNLANNIPDEVVDTLLTVCQNNSATFQRYFLLKARWIGMERLRRYDIYAPVAQADKLYPFDQAVKMVMDTFQEFDPEIARPGAARFRSKAPGQRSS